MHLQLIRSATVRIRYAGQVFVIDPYLAAKYTMRSCAGKSPNPLVDLPCPPHDVIRGIDFVIVSHFHSDHFDVAAQKIIPKDMPLLCQPGDEATIEAQGFQKVIPVAETIERGRITITRTNGQHGQGAVREEMGDVSGFVFQAEGEPTVYWVGDTIYCDAVQTVIERIKPDIIVTHSCGAVWTDNVLIVMDAAQTVTVCQTAPESIVVATHMDSVDHATVSREELRNYAQVAGIAEDRLRIPADGETLTF